MYPTIENITIEMSTFCNAECVICPNSKLETRRKLHLMSLEDFENTLNLFPNLKTISLCGCYEPLLDSRLSQIFDIIKNINLNMKITMFIGNTLLNLT
jgi:molybdenum cofactor biosynthesis enzyme MoaA